LQSTISHRRILSLIGGQVRLEKSFIHAIFPNGFSTWRFVQIREEVFNDPIIAKSSIRNPSKSPDRQNHHFPRADEGRRGSPFEKVSNFESWISLLVVRGPIVTPV
jgi:hypothetical protein